MGPRISLVFLLLFTKLANAGFELQPLKVSEEKIQADIELILKKANLEEDAIKFRRTDSTLNQVSIKCDKEILLEVKASGEEWSSTLYFGLQKLGFLFPHPRVQITPKSQEMRSHCNKTYTWRPALKYRGFHLHTLHAGEWIDGFLMGKKEIAIDLIRWLLRNNQNTFDLSLLRMQDEKIFSQLKPLFTFARELGIHPGVTFGIAFHQQNSYKLVSLWAAPFDEISKNQIDKNLNKLLDNLPLSFINVEMGTSEFTPVNYQRMLDWLNQVGKISKKEKVQMMTKVHASTNQKSKEFGNFNFLPQFADSSVGILPHTVFYHGLNDPDAPLYGNKNFSYMRDFLLQENKKRMTWFYPETSYYIGLDIDAPLFITEYLRARAEDMKFLSQNDINGVLNFSTGQENGYWLMDWSQTLYNNLDYEFEPTIGLKLLGEQKDFWEDYLSFQKEYLTDKTIISILSFSNFGEELFPEHKILKRNTLKELSKDKKVLKAEIQKLKAFIKSSPTDFKKIKNTELRSLVQITALRALHAKDVREALLNKKQKKKFLLQAKKTRQRAQLLMNIIIKDYNRYPESFVYKEKANPSAYPYGYGFASSNLHYWKREEMMVQEDNFSPFFMNIWDFIDIIF